MAPSTPTRSIVYKRVEGLELQLHLFEPNISPKSNEPRPAIVFFHGGGWEGGAPDQFFAQCAYFASRGLVTMSVQYRLNLTPFDCLRDAKSALRWVRAHAEELGIHDEQILAGGGSAGGHLAAATALVSGFDEPGETTSIDCRPKALLLFNPVIDNSAEGYGYDRVQDQWQAFSPMHQINKEAPPTIFHLGDKDDLIPVTTGQHYRDRMEQLGRRCDLHVYENAGHGFFNPHTPKYFSDTVQKTDRFLASLGYLHGEPDLSLLPSSPS